MGLGLSLGLMGGIALVTILFGNDGFTHLGAMIKGVDYQQEIQSDVRDAEHRIHDKINEERTRHGLAPLAWNEDNAGDARLWSQQMYTSNKFEHSTTFCMAENIYMKEGGPMPASEPVDAWMESPGHKANILRTSFHSEGIGIYTDGHATYVTQNFC